MLSLGILGLCATFAAKVFLSRQLLRRAEEPQWPVTIAFATMLMSVVPALLCRITENLVVAVLISGVLAAAGAAFLYMNARDSAPASAPPCRPQIWAILVAGVGLFFVVWVALNTFIWDEHWTHFGISNVIARGVVPPEYPIYPGEPFRYHYGFNVLVGAVRAFTGMRVESAIDLVAVGCYLLLLSMAVTVGGRLARRAGASLALVLVPLGSGTLLFLLFRDTGPLMIDWSAIPPSWNHNVPPPVISNFFQHPQGLGIPVALAVLLLHDRPYSGDAIGKRRLVLGAVLLGMLSLTQVVFFFVVGLVLAVSVLLGAAHHRRLHTAAVELGVLLLAPLIAVLLGGMFAPGGKIGGRIIFGKGLFSEPAITWILHHLLAFGLPLCALPLALTRLSRPPARLRQLFFSGSLIGFVVPMVASDRLGWDIVKFYGVGCVFANVLFADLLAPLLEKRGVIRYAGVAIAICAATVTSWVWLARMSIMDGKWGVPPVTKVAYPEVDAAVGERLGPLVGPRERVFTTDKSLQLATGFLTPGFNWRIDGSRYLLDRARCDKLTWHFQRARKHLRKADLDALEVRFAVLSPADIRGLSSEGRAALDDGSRFEHLFDVRAKDGVRRVFRIRQSGSRGP